VIRPHIDQPGQGDVGSAAIRIGIMADSHGDPALLEAAIAVFRSRECAGCVHLGDIVDTARPETAGECLRRLNKLGILAIRGNNEHTLLLNQSSGIDKEAFETIREMPVVRRIECTLLAHSLPFETAMGPRCMFEDMTTDHLGRFFHSYPGMQLFRGHSHQPEVIRPKGAALYREKCRPGGLIPLPARQSAVITCGALADGLCLVWDRQKETIEFISVAGGRKCARPPD